MDIASRLTTRYFFLKRGFWYIFYYGFAQHLPASYRFQPLGRFAKWCRALACKRLFRSCGERVNVEKGADFYTGWEIELGDNSSLGIDCMLPYDLKVGKDVMMGPYVVIIGNSHQFSQSEIPMRLQGIKEYKSVRIEDDVWIGARAIILPGVRVGKGSIIGAGTVVTKDIPPYAIVAGNPGRVLRYRDGQSQIDKPGVQ